MLLTISTTYVPATDLGFLLHKNPAKVQSFPLSFGQAHVFYPEATSERCTAALLLDVDPIGLVRNRRGPAGESGLLAQYVNDRPYVASSFLSVAIAQVYGSALSGKSRERPELAELPIPLEAKLAVVACRGGEGLLRRLFEPLGYGVTATSHPLDEQFPDWGASPYYTVELWRTCCVSELLSHLYLLIPVLDDEKHYWVGDAEVDKLLRHGEGWLATHPERERIAQRYLRHQRGLVRSALGRLIEQEGEAPSDEDAEAAEERLEAKVSLNEQRLGAVLSALKDSGAQRIVDLGCGEGKLLRLVCEERQFTSVLGMEVSPRSLEIAEDGLRRARCLDHPDRARLIQGSLMYRDNRIHGYDAASVVEVVEHLDPPRLAAFERVLFEFARPRTVVLTTPNVEYNVKFEGLAPGEFRHRDHRFEWTRAEFRQWAEGIADRFGYAVRFGGIGDEDPALGPPTQMAVFTAEQKPSHRLPQINTDQTEQK
jgi:3' terminal RNA ribose 2'-O-methyltransferase Hen1